MLMVLLVAAAVIAILYLCFGRLESRAITPAIVDAQNRAARAWADKLGMRVTGVACDGRSCTVALECGPPIRAYCGDDGACSVETCK
jgi:RimJ/RimL family protein N-acetyltransferase